MKFTDLPESERRPIRAAYYRLHNKSLTDDVADKMSPATLLEYKRWGKAALRKDGSKGKAWTVIGVFLLLGGWIGMAGMNNNSDPPPSSTPVNLVQPADQVPTPSSDISPAAAASPDYDEIDPADNAGNCSPNYSPCVPDVSYDLDCADIGESVEVIGSDTYRLDRDGDGIGCDSY